MYYIKRLIENKITNKLENFGAICITGPKFCGKTTTSEKFARSAIYLKESEQILNKVLFDNKTALIGDRPHLIDEWQMVPFLWNAVKTSVDQEKRNGCYILCGSNTVAEDKIKVLHSGAGRISTIKMRTMSLQEMGLSNKIVNLSNLLAKNQQINHSDESLKLEDYAKCIIKGGWPDNLKKNEINSASMVEDYIEYICAKENVNAKFTIQYQRLKAIIESLARNVAHETSLNTIAIDMRLGSTVPTDETVRSYLDHLTSIFILEELESWKSHIRSTVRTKNKPKWHFVDVSIASNALGLSSEDLINDFESLGLFFESLVVQNLRVYSDFLDSKVYFYKDSNNLEIDAIIEDRKGNFSAFEVKLGSEKGINDGIKNLRAFVNKLDPNKTKFLSSLNIIVASNYSYTTEDGINIIPLSHLFVE